MARQIYLDINTRPRQVLQVMDRLADQVGRYRAEWKRLWLAIGGLVIVGGVFWIIDNSMDYPNSGFGTLACLFWIGVGGLLIYALIRGSARLPREQFDTASQIIYTLRDDVGRRGRVTGWLDLTGPQQKSKLLRTGRTSSGRTKYYYRDPWLSIKTRLVDGNLLRLTLTERIKVKKGYVAGRRHQIKVKLVVNPQVYDIGPGQRLPGLTQDGTILQLQGTKPSPLTAQEVLSSLKVMYSHLQPRQPTIPTA